MLMDAFWMGVPAVTLASRPPLGRLGSTMLMNLGLPDWIATTEAEYLDKACRFAGQPQALNELRLGFRDRLRGCPLMDGPAFARGVEVAYRAMYEQWLEGAAP
jgi:predicted O-linked N-acetylglucosamine transferase (SPINDLY family)